MSFTSLLVAAAHGNTLPTNQSSAPVGISTANEYAQIMYRGDVIMQVLSLVLGGEVPGPYDLRLPLRRAAQQGPSRGRR